MRWKRSICRWRKCHQIRGSLISKETTFLPTSSWKIRNYPKASVWSSSRSSSRKKRKRSKNKKPRSVSASVKCMEFPTVPNTKRMMKIQTTPVREPTLRKAHGKTSSTGLCQRTFEMPSTSLRWRRNTATSTIGWGCLTTRYISTPPFSIARSQIIRKIGILSRKRFLKKNW